MWKLSDIFKENTSYKMFIVSVVGIGLSWGLYKGIIDNYLTGINGLKCVCPGLI